MSEKTVAPISDKATTLTGTLQDGQSSRVSEEEVLGYMDIPPGTHEMAAILQFGISYEMVEYLARQQVAVTAKMVDSVNMSII